MRNRTSQNLLEFKQFIWIGKKTILHRIDFSTYFFGCEKLVEFFHFSWNFFLFLKTLSSNHWFLRFFIFLKFIYLLKSKNLATVVFFSGELGQNWGWGLFENPLKNFSIQDMRLTVYPSVTSSFSKLAKSSSVKIDSCWVDSWGFSVSRTYLPVLALWRSWKEFVKTLK